MKISATFSKYMEGQQVSAYDKNDNIIDGFVKIKNNKKYILDENGKGHLMTEMKKIKQVGRRLNEEAEDAYKDDLNKFSDYYKNTFDTEKVEKADDKVKEKIINQYIDTADSSVKANSKAFSKDALTMMNTSAAQEQIDAGNSTVDVEIEKLKKDAEDGNLTESLFDNKRIQKAILQEMEVTKTEDADYIQPKSEFGLGLAERENAIDWCSQKIDDGVSKDAIVEGLQLEYEMSKDEAERMYNELAVNVDFTDNFAKDAYKMQHPEKCDETDWLDWTVEFEEALDSIPKELYGKNCVVEYLAEHFNLDAQKALKESNDIGEAIHNLIRQAENSR